MEDAGSSDNAR